MVIINIIITITTLKKINVEPSVDIIIATYNRPDHVRRLAYSLLKIISPSDTLTIVAQGLAQGSPIPKAQWLHVASPNLSRARNLGLKNGSADIVLYFDDDVEVDKNVIEMHRRAYVNPEIGAVAGFIRDPLFDSKIENPSWIDLRTGECVQNFSINKSQYCISLMGANMSFRRKVLLSIGGFDENYRGNALWEDIDCAFRIRIAGYRIWYCSDAKVNHLRVPDGGCRVLNNVAYSYHEYANTTYFACKYVAAKSILAWMHFWKNRLEYVSRKEDDKNKHRISIVIAAVLGVFSGIFRYCFSKYPLRPRVTRGSLGSTV